MAEEKTQVSINDEYVEKYGFNVPEDYVFKSRKGLNEDVVKEISWMKKEPQWMTEFRLRSLASFNNKPMPNWGSEVLHHIDFDDIYYYIKPTDKQADSWEELPQGIKDTYDKLGIPEAEKKYLAGVGAQYESEVIYHNLAKELEDKGVIFKDTDSALREHPELFREYFGTIIPYTDNKFAALNSAVWSGGCLTANARVFTADQGAKSIADIRRGDTVLAMSQDSKLVPAKVLEHIHNGQKPVFRFRAAGRTIEATENHQFLTLEKSDYPLDHYGSKWVMRWKPLAELQIGDVVAVAKKIPSQSQSRELPTLPNYIRNHHHRDGLTSPMRTSEDLMWLLGVWMGDGNSYSPYEHGHMRIINFALPTNDSARKEAIQVIKQLFNYEVRTQNEASITLHSKAIGEWMDGLDFVGKAKTKRIPKWVYGLPIGERLAFLGGLTDSDGWIENDGKTIAFELCNKDLVEDIKLLAISCGLYSDGKIRERQRENPYFEREDRHIRTGTAYACRITGNVVQVGCRNSEKHNKLAQANKGTFNKYTTVTGENFSSVVSEDIGFAPIREKEYIGVQDVYDIQVEGYANFVANGIIAHNSFIYVPKGVKIDMPLQAYFRINAKNVGQFERTLIIVDEGAQVHYVEGCFLAGARVRVRGGEKPIEQIQVGDEVLTHKGRYRRVYNTMRRSYSGTIYNIKYFGDSRQMLRVTEEHPLLVVKREQLHNRNKQFNTEWAVASQVKPGDYLAIPIPKTELQTYAAQKVVTIPFGYGRHEAQERNVTLKLEPDFFRLLGYYHAEGHVDNEHYLTFSFNANESTYLDDTKELVARYFGKAPNANKARQNGQTLVLSSTETARTFAREFGSSFRDKRVPDYVLNAPLTQLKQWVRGMWCGDGSYDERKNMFRFNTVSAELAYAFRDALLRLGIAASVNYQLRDEPRQPMFAVIISSPHNQKFGEIVDRVASNGNMSGSPFHMDGNFMYVPIRSVEIEEMDTLVYNFSVEEDESYVGEGVVSHNCTAPVYSSDSLHSAVVEIIVKKGGRCRYTTIQNWSTNVYNLVTKRAAAYQDATMEWVDGNLGCLAEGSTVTTPDGIKTIESLNVGDEVLSYDDKSGELVFRRVNAKRFSGYQKVHSVNVGERKLKVTSNHPFYSYTYDAGSPKKLGRYQLAYVRADQLEKVIIPRTSVDYGKPHLLTMPVLTTSYDSRNQFANDLVVSRERQSRLKVDSHTTDELMWLFGYWLGDGNIEIEQGKTEGVLRWAKVGFSTPPTDRAHGRLLNTMSSVMETEPTTRADGNHLYWSSKELAEFFTLNGFRGNAHTKRVPKWVSSLPESQRVAFIAGYLDADGTVVDSKREFSLKSANKALLEDVASVLVTLGITPRLYTEFDTPKIVKILGVEATAHGSHRLSFGLDSRLCNAVSAQMQTKAEQSPKSKLLHRRAVGRSKITLPAGVEIVDVEVSELIDDAVPTWDIEVEGTGSFVSQGFIVHNSKLTMKYPAVYLMEPGAHGEILSIAFAGKGQHQDAGGKVVHAAPNTTSKIVSKSISKDGGRTSYRGLLKVYKDAVNAKSNVVCDALLLDEASRSDTYPYIEVDNEQVNIGHEASVSKIGEEQLFYAMSRGVSEEDASTMVVSGFIEPLVKELPMEYAMEMNRLIALQMEGTVG